MSVFRLRKASKDENGKYISNTKDIMEETKDFSYERIPSPSVSYVINHYTDLTEDELFDYEKVVVPFTKEKNGRKVNLILIIENGKISIENEGLVHSEDLYKTFSNYFSRAEFNIACESQVHKLQGNTTERLTWVQTQQPGLYKSPEGLFIVFRDMNGNMNYMLEGSDQVWFSSPSPDEEPKLNLSLSNGNTILERPDVSQETLDAKAKLRNSPEFQRFMENLGR